MDQLIETLAFRREALVNFLLVSTILGAFAMSGVFALLTLSSASRLRSSLFLILTAASLLFVLATALAVVILPAMGRPDSLAASQIQGLLSLYRVVMASIIVGTFLLVASLGGIGFLVSRRVGTGTLLAAFATCVVFASCAIYLSRTLA